jgi:hypothetical protein
MNIENKLEIKKVDGDDDNITLTNKNNSLNSNCVWDGNYCIFENCDGFKCKRIIREGGKKATKDMYNIQTMCQSNKTHCGKYMFPINETFWKLYQKKHLKNLLETRGKYSKFVMDFDIKYPSLDDNLFDNRKFYTDEMIYETINITRNYLQQYIPILENDKLDCCVLEKDIYKTTSTKGEINYKGGVHLQFIDFTIENKSLSTSGFLEDLKNAIEKEVGLELDIGAYNNAWFLYGSSKDINLEPYVLTKIVGRIEKDNNVELFDIPEYFNLDDNQLDLYLPKLLSIKSYGDDDIEQFTLHKLKKDDDQISTVSSKTKKGKKEKKEYNQSQFSLEIFKKLITCYKPERSSEYYPWILMCFALKNACNGDDLGLECFKLFSDNNINYNESSCESLYYSTELRDKDKDERVLTVSSLYYWAKFDNETLFYELFPSYKNSYFLMKKEFELTHFKNINNGCYYEIDEKSGKVKQINPKNILEDRYCHMNYTIYDENGDINDKVPFIKTWVHDSNIRMYDNVNIILPPNICPKNTYNLFRGYDCQKVILKESEKIDLQPLLDKVLNHFNLIFDIYKDYCWKYIASMIQQPGVRSNVAIMIKSLPGVGKEIFWNFLKKILTDDYCFNTVNVDRDVFGQFNPLCRNKLLYLWDEMEYKVSSSLKEKMKSFITSSTITINDKGRTPFELNSIPFVFLFSNNQFPLPIDESDRRFFGMDISHIKPENKEYFDDLIDLMENEKVIRMLYDHIMNIDISEFNIRNFPISEFVKEVKTLSRPRELDFMIYFLQQEREAIKNMDLYNEFGNWLSDNYSDYREYKTNTKSFGIKLKNFKIDGMIKNEKNYGVYWTFDIEKTNKWLLSNQYITEKPKNEEV